MYNQRSSEFIRHLDFEIIDLFCMIVCYFLVGYLRQDGNIMPIFSPDHMTIIILFILIQIIVCLTNHSYKGIIQRGYWKEAVAIIKHFSIVFGFLIVAFYLNHESSALPRLTIGCSWILSIFVAYGIHTLRKHTIRLSLKRTMNLKHMLLISDTRRLAETYREITRKPYARYDVTAVCLMDIDENIALNPADYSYLPEGLPILKGSTAAQEYVRQQVVDDVFLDVVPEEYQTSSIALQCIEMGITVFVSLPHEMMQYPNSAISHLGDRIVVRTTKNSAYSWQLGLKRLTDICGALVGLMLTGIVAIFLVPAIKLADPGPAIFKQKRVGTNGRVFDFYKFRSMYMDAEERKKELMSQNQMKGLMFKLENDPRIIGSEKGPGKGLGNFIRKTSLDELPQFWNILKGDMSLVGTRPPTLNEYEQYEPWHKVRLSMKPGLTGMWQVSGRSDITDFENVVRMDSEYIENWNLGLDIKILLKTVLVVLKGEGSR